MSISSSSPHSSFKKNQNSDHSKVAPIPRMVWLVGIIMFCANLASVIVYTYGGVYLKKMGFASMNVGLIEGLAEGTSNIMKLVSGVLSDAFRRRKVLMMIGYGTIVIARYLLALWSMFAIPVVMARIMERIGNGVQAAPRSALVGDISPPKRIGACYGLKRSLATLGSFTGAAVALLIMFMTHNNYRILFAFTVIPTTIGFILLLIKVKEPHQIKHAAVLSGIPSYAPKYRPKFNKANVKLLGGTFWKLMTVNFIFLLARMGETFLVMYGRYTFHLDESLLPTVMMVFNVSWSLSSYPVGLIADKMNRYWLLCLGMGTLILSDFVLSTANGLVAFYFGIMLWGIQYGTTQNIFLSLISEIVPENLRGTGLGIYWITCTIATIVCDTTMGRIIDCYDSMRAAFITSGCVSVLGLMSLIVIMGYKIRSPNK
ncbi:MAG: MFS transporter [Holosporales bacterium]|jgi:MFS family permease|nr:MFS transporter [Holosporales bacterium]